jgi:hypothetical protein
MILFSLKIVITSIGSLICSSIKFKKRPESRSLLRIDFSVPTFVWTLSLIHFYYNLPDSFLSTISDKKRGSEIAAFRKKQQNSLPDLLDAVAVAVLGGRTTQIHLHRLFGPRRPDFKLYRITGKVGSSQALTSVTLQTALRTRVHMHPPILAIQKNRLFYSGSKLPGTTTNYRLHSKDGKEQNRVEIALFHRINQLYIFLEH